MSTLLIDLEVKPGRDEALLEAYQTLFRPGISEQSGFELVEMFRPLEGARWLIMLRFSSEEARQNWVATDLHARAWGAIEAECESHLATLCDVVA